MSKVAPQAEVVAIVPARGGSKGIPGKNLKEIGGVPLIARVVRAARRTKGIDAAVVSTDDPRIAAAARIAGADIVDRPQSLAGDEATSESALVHALEQLAADGIDPGVIVFMQATSPFIDSDVLAAAVARVSTGAADVVFSAVPFHGFVWRDGDEGVAAVDHDMSFRPRRQEREPRYLETGAFYVMRTEGFRAAGHRFFGRVEVALVDPRTAFEVDEPSDLALAEALAPYLGEGVQRGSTSTRLGPLARAEELYPQSVSTERAR